MNKPLLLGSALLVAISAYSQNGRIKPSGAIERAPKKIEYSDATNHNSTSAVVGPVKHVSPKVNSASKIMAATKFTGSMNVFGYLVSQSKPLTYNAGINTVAFVHRKSQYYNAASNSNSGTIVAMIGTNAGTVWDSTCIWANASNLARYPQGGIYNPLGNTNKNNAYIVGMGPITGGSGWLGNWYASKSLSGAGTNAAGADQQAMLNASPTLKKHEFSRYGFTAIDGGLVRSIGTIWNDANNTTSAAAQGLRGAIMAKGQFNAGAFVWSVDSFVPATTLHSAGQKNIGGTPSQAWSEDGVIGYVVMLGSRASETLSATRVNAKGGYQPIVYKTTNSGASWTLLPAEDFASPTNFRGVWDRTYPIVSSSVTTIPNFSGSEGFDVTVDINGNLHFVSMTYGHYSNHTDSLGYRYVFGTEQYSYASGNFNWPIIYDFYTKSSGGWSYHMVDSMYSEGPSGTSGQPGYNTNSWTDGSGAKMDLDARIQVSRSVDGKKILYSWTESDTSFSGTKWNIYPDIIMKGYDVTIDKVTPRVQVTNGVTNVTSSAFYHYMSNKAIGSSSVCMEVPFTVTYNGGLDGSVAVDTYYLNGTQICPTSFSVNPLRPVGVNEATKAEVNFEVVNYPNPASGSTTILVGLKDAKAFEVAIYNAVGQLVDTYKVNGHIGGNEIHIDLNNFSAGVYVYNVKVGNSTVTKKLIVQ